MVKRFVDVGDSEGLYIMFQEDKTFEFLITVPVIESLAIFSLGSSGHHVFIKRHPNLQSRTTIKNLQFNSGIIRFHKPGCNDGVDIGNVNFISID